MTVVIIVMIGTCVLYVCIYMYVYISVRMLSVCVFGFFWKEGRGQLGIDGSGLRILAQASSLRGMEVVPG